MNPTITLAQIRAKSPCEEGWKKLLAGLGYKDGKYDTERVVSLGDIATTNDALDALWCVRVLDWANIEVRRAVIAGAVMPAVERAAKHTKDRQVHNGIADLKRWCDGDSSIDLEKVGRNLRAAASTAAYAAIAFAIATADAATAFAIATADAAAEREQQRRDIIAAFPPVALKKAA